MDRRQFLNSSSGLIAAGSMVNSNLFASMRPDNHTVSASEPTEIYFNQYAVTQYYAREGIKFTEHIDRCLAEMKEAGFAGLEIMAGQPQDVDFYLEALNKRQLQLRTFYSGANLHDEATAEAEVKRVIALAERVKTGGANVAVVNPQPKSGKSDVELERQNRYINLLGAELRKIGINLALHYHTVELEFAAREFHSMMCDTDPVNVSLCYDVHWSFRGSGNSAVSAYNHAQLYAGRVIELHLRQSHSGIWSETFTPDGDIDYMKALAILRQNKGFNDCYVVLEQVPEDKTPKTLNPLDCFKKNVDGVKRLFRI